MKNLLAVGLIIFVILIGTSTVRAWLVTAPLSAGTAQAVCGTAILNSGNMITGIDGGSFVNAGC